MKDVINWNCEDVGKWLKEIGFESYIPLLCNKHKIDGVALLTLREEDFKNPPLQITVLGDVKKLMVKLHAVQQQNISAVNSLGLNPQLNYDTKNGSNTRNRSKQSNNSRKFDQIDATDNGDFNENADSTNNSSNRSKNRRNKKTFAPEIWKTVLSFIYVTFVFLLTSFVMVIVHDRVPDMNRYPPLPDLFLDNMPYVPWAFRACEIVGIILGTIWFFLLFFHKYRFILLRRFFSLFGTVFLLRSFTMLITSLSVPGQHLDCQSPKHPDMWSRLHRATEIVLGAGMTLQGVRTCGDYMFSGHTCVITLLNFFITEYSCKSKMYYLHLVTWVLNLFGIYFILAAHEHYSIDVFVAFYLSSRLFMYYHTLANNRSLMQRDAKRTRIWFPLFAFFESKCEGEVPNEYEWPVPSWCTIKEMYCNYKTKLS